MISVLGLALSLVCAFSQQDCEAAHKTPAEFHQTSNSWASAFSFGDPLAETLWTGEHFPKNTYINPKFTDPMAIAALEVHEYKNQRDGWPHANKECGDWMAAGFTEQRLFITWTIQNFNPSLDSVNGQAFFTNAIVPSC